MTEELAVDYQALLSPGGLLSEAFRRHTTESFDDFLSLSTSMDGDLNWPVECDMLLAEFVSRTASKEGQSPYNLSCEQIIAALAFLGEKSPLKGIDLSRIIARIAVIRVANSLISSAIPYLTLILPEEKWSADCFGSRETDIGLVRKDVPTAPHVYTPRGESEMSSAHHINRMDRDMNYLGDNHNQLAVDSQFVWAPPCGARRLHVMRRVLFTQTKKIFWDNVLESTTTATPLNQDEYEDPREIKDIRINRVKASNDWQHGRTHSTIRVWSTSSRDETVAGM